MQAANQAVMLPARLSTAKPWKPAPFRPGSSSFSNPVLAGKRIGQPSKGTLFDDPRMALLLSGASAALAAISTAKLDGAGRILAWAVLIGAGTQTLVSGVRYFRS